MLDLTNLTPGQERVVKAILQGSHKRVAWIGSARSGKGVGAVLAMVLLSQQHARAGVGNGEYILAAQTQGAFERNSMGYFRDVAAQLGLKCVARRGRTYYLEVGGAIFHVFGGAKAGDEVPVTGITASGAWLDEATLLKRPFVDLVYTRMSYAAAPVLFTSNTSNPFNWVRVSLIDAPDVLYVESSATENHHYEQAQFDYLKQISDGGPTFRRLLHNEWAPEEGVVWPIDGRHLTDSPPSRGVVALDAGTAGVTAALLFVKHEGGWVVADEYYHDAKRLGELTDDEHTGAILDKWDVERWVVDPAAASIKAQLRRAQQRVGNAQNDIIEGCQAVRNALFTGRLLVGSRCRELLSEMGSYVWNPVTDKPAPTARDHACDALRYGVMDLLPNRARIVT